MLRDHLGSTRLLTDPSKAIAQNLDYLPFGENISTDSGISTHKFTGDERDSETSLDHTLFRQYSFLSGRWTSPDRLRGSLLNPQSLNRYAYVGNNPLNARDPLGLTSYSLQCAPNSFAARCVSGGGGGGDCTGGAGCQFNGNDIFEAIGGVPGTYISYNTHGQMSFGFSPDLFSSTLNYADQVNSQNIQGCFGVPPSAGNARVCTTLELSNTGGYQVSVQDLGTDIVVSGLIPELAAVQANAAFYYHQEEYTNYSLAVNGLQIDPNTAYHDLIEPNPQAAADWHNYQAAFNQIMQILEQYLPAVQTQSAPYPAPLQLP